MAQIEISLQQGDSQDIVLVFADLLVTVERRVWVGDVDVAVIDARQHERKHHEHSTNGAGVHRSDALVRDRGVCIEMNTELRPWDQDEPSVFALSRLTDVEESAMRFVIEEVDSAIELHIAAVGHQPERPLGVVAAIGLIHVGQYRVESATVPKHLTKIEVRLYAAEDS